MTAAGPIVFIVGREGGGPLDISNSERSIDERSAVQSGESALLFLLGCADLHPSGQAFSGMSKKGGRAPGRPGLSDPIASGQLQASTAAGRQGHGPRPANGNVFCDVTT